jgi:L-amino acid N-acyltransferase YncA
MTRKAVTEDARAISSIYNHYVLNTVVTFEEEAVTEQEMGQRMQQVMESYPWLVFEEGGEVVGYGYAGRWKERAAYRHSVETSIYLKPGFERRGIGTNLFGALIEALRQMDINAVIGGVALPNEASIRLHESLGFEKIGQFRQVGLKFGKWVDVGYWELLLKED